MGLGGLGGQFSGQHQHLHRNITKKHQDREKYS
jgi:hypothetical protein